MQISGEPTRFSRRTLVSFPARSRLAAAVARLPNRSGRRLVYPVDQETFLQQLGHKLRQSGNSLPLDLSLREMRSLVRLFWAHQYGWSPTREVVRQWLDWVDGYWNTRSAVFRIFKASFEGSLGQREFESEIAEWLDRKVLDMRHPIGDVVRSYKLQRPMEAIDAIANEIVSGRDAFREGLRTVSFPNFPCGSAFSLFLALEILRRSVELPLSAYERIMENVRWLLGKGGLDAVALPSSVISEIRGRMLGSVIDWGERVVSDDRRDMASRICIDLAGDPRRSRARWGKVPEDRTRLVLRWLTRRTVHNLFRMMEMQQVSVNEMKEERLEFWNAYLEHIDSAFLLCERNAAMLARSLDEDHGTIISANKEHCGLLMDLVGPAGAVRALFFSQVAPVLFWSTEDDRAPRMFSKDVVVRGDLRETAESKVSHHFGWQNRMSLHIRERTGIVTRWCY